MAGYIRQSQADIVPGVVVQAAPLNNEFNALSNSFSGSTGHTHDGSLGNGPRISLSNGVTGILSVANGGTGASTLLDIQANLGLTIGEHVQAWSPFLDKISAMTTLGVLTKTTDTDWALRLIKGKEKEITVAPENGATGDYVISIPNAATFTGKTVTGGTFTGGTFTSGTFSGSGSGLTSIPVSGIVGLGAEMDKKMDKAGGIFTGPVNFSDNIAMGSGKVLSQSTNPTQPAHVVNKQTLDTANTDNRKRENHTGEQPMSTITGLATELAKYLKLAGGVMSGILDMGAQRITNLALGTQPTDAVRFDQLQEAVPSGIMSPFGGIVAPTGWLLCNGQAVSRTTYSKLFAAIGTRFGAGDGISTFNLPNFGGRTPVGADTGTTIGRPVTVGLRDGAATYSLSTGNVPPHHHEIDVTTQVSGKHKHNYTLAKARDWDSQAGDWIGQGGESLVRTGTQRILEGGEHTHRVVGVTKSSGNAEPYNVVQPYLGVTFIIKI